MSVFECFEVNRRDRGEDAVLADIEAYRSMPYVEYLRTPYWALLRAYFVQDRGACCRRCGQRGVMLNVHHRTYEHLGEEYRYPEDLMVLCRECHKKEHAEQVYLNRLLGRKQAREFVRRHTL